MSKPVLIFLSILTVPILFRVYGTITKVAKVPAPIKHLAVIMDGNRRWASKHNVKTYAGHTEGARTVKRLLQYCLERHIEVVSVYAFSLENFQRAPEEVNAIFKIMVDEAKPLLPELIKNGIKVRFIGDNKVFPQSVVDTINRLETETKDCNKLLFNILFCYGGRQEIVDAVHRIIKDLQSGVLKTLPDEKTFKNYLWTHEIPDPDLIIRTGGIKRLSNFLTYQTSYSELYFTDRLWPDLTEKDLDEALKDYSKRKRNFGK